MARERHLRSGLGRLWAVTAADEGHRTFRCPTGFNGHTVDPSTAGAVLPEDEWGALPERGQRKTVPPDRGMTVGTDVRRAQAGEAQEIHETLSQAFEPLRPCYTAEAYDVTVPTPDEIRERIDDSATHVLVATRENEIVGTVTIRAETDGELHLGSMAVKPTLHGRGIGWQLLREIERLARERSCPTISLESFEPLTKAIALYERFGFKRTGKERPYHGIIVFEMRKDQTLRVSSDP